MDFDRFYELEKKLNPKKRKFVEVYSVCGNVIDALHLAGYKPGTGYTARSMAYKMLREPDCSEYLELLRAYAKDTTVVTASRLLDELMKLSFFDASRVVDENGKFRSEEAFKEAGRNIKAISYNAKTGARKIDFYDKTDAIEKLARHIGFYEKDNEQKAPEGVQFYLPENGRPDNSAE